MKACAICSFSPWWAGFYAAAQGAAKWPLFGEAIEFILLI
jgi:hypothetical protein